MLMTTRGCGSPSFVFPTSRRGALSADTGLYWRVAGSYLLIGHDFGAGFMRGSGKYYEDLVRISVRRVY